MQPSTVGQIERKTQNRVVKLFGDELDYTYLGNWEDRPNNSNIEGKLLASYLTKKGSSPTHIAKALYELRVTANNYKGGISGTSYSPPVKRKNCNLKVLLIQRVKKCCLLRAYLSCCNDGVVFGGSFTL